MFIDPLGQFSFELPLGWGYNLVRSYLNTTVFTRADQPNESISIRCLPSFSPDASLEEWQTLARAEAFPEEVYSSRALNCGDKSALFANYQLTDASDSNMQVLLLQGKRMDILVQHCNTELLTDDGMSEVLLSVCGSLLVPTDYVKPEHAEQGQVMALMQAAQAASALKDWAQVCQAASRALIQARDTYLSSIVERAKIPEFAAVETVIDALVFLGQAQADMFDLRNAELLVYRVQNTVHALEDLSDAEKHRALKDLDARQKTIATLQSAVMQLLEGYEKDDKETLVMQRAKFLLHNACIASERLDYDSALSSAICAVEDMSLLQASIQQAPDSLDGNAMTKDREILGIANDSSGEQQIAFSKRLLNRFLLGEFIDALRVLASVRAGCGEETGALQASRLLVSISRALDRPEPTPTGYILPFKGHRHHLAASTLELIENLLLATTQPDLENVRWKLDDVEMMLDELKEGSVLRAKLEYLKGVTNAIAQHNVPEGMGGESLVRQLINQHLGSDTLQTLTDWALAAAPPIPGEAHKSVPLPRPILMGGPAAIITHVIKYLPESDAAKFWQSTAPTVKVEQANKADQYIKQWMESVDWRHGWAIAVLRALDQHCPLNHWGILTGLEYARACLVQPPVLIDYALKQVTEKDNLSAEALLFDEEPTFESSPFGDQRILAVLRSLDFLIVAQEAQPTRLHDVLQDLKSSVQHDLILARDTLKKFPAGMLFRQSIYSLGVGSALSLLLRYRAEEAENQGELTEVRTLGSTIIRVATRYGTTTDFLFAVHRINVATARGNPVMQPELYNMLCHLKLAAQWCGDASLEATVEHARGALLRDFLGKTPGLIKAIAAFQRAATLRDQLGETVEAAGSLIDMSALLIAYGKMLDMLEEGREWPDFANRYLLEAVERLLSQEQNSITLKYLGEAFQNRARMHLSNGALSEAATDALRSIGLAIAIEFSDLENRARQTLALVVDDPEAHAANIKELPELLADIQRTLEQEQDDVRRVSNKAGSFNTVLDMLFEQAGKAIDIPKASELILKEIESSRGFTYNRWLGFAPVTHTKKLIHELQEDPSHPVLAIYAVTSAGVALLVLDGEQPLQFCPLDTTAKELEALLETHLKGLLKQGRMRGKLPWQRFQSQFMASGWRLVSPLEPYVKAGRTICFVPHRVLHGATLHALPTTPDGEPIGLRTPMFSNPSITNWLAAKKNAMKFASQAFVGITCPERELAEFAEAAVVANILAETGIDVSNPDSSHVDLGALVGHNWQVLHLSSHGMFDEQNREIGLLLSHDNILPPPPGQFSNKKIRNHLATPNDLRRAGLQAKLSFLASCLSSRNQQFPGDDLMGVTRAVFASGSADLIAGAWTVVSSITQTFAACFYQVLITGRPVAQAVFEARKAVARTHPDPFFWGVFVHQGANINPLRGRGGEK